MARRRKQKKIYPYIIATIVGLLIITIIVTLLITGSPSSLTTDSITMSPTEKTDDNKLRIISFNIHYGSGYTNAYMKNAVGQDRYTYLDQIAEIISSADIVLMQEVDKSVRRSHFIDELEYLREKAGFSYSHFSDNWNFRLLPFLNPTNFGKLRTGHGILSRHPIKDADTYTFQKPHASFWHRWFFLWRTQQYVDIDINDQTLRVFNVHLESESQADRISQATQLKQLVTKTKHPTILMGDFNAILPEATDKDFPNENYLDDPTIEIIRETDLKELFPPSQYTREPKKYFTFPSRKPDRRLDYMFYSEEIDIITPNTLQQYKEASDHIPIQVDFRLR
ncbi:endonuclease/exonuclease/phosphatase family protein [Nanoarchaeota archaeon]